MAIHISDAILTDEDVVLVASANFNPKSSQEALKKLGDVKIKIEGGKEEPVSEIHYDPKMHAFSFHKPDNVTDSSSIIITGISPLSFPSHSPYSLLWPMVKMLQETVADVENQMKEVGTEMGKSQQMQQATVKTIDALSMRVDAMSTKVEAIDAFTMKMKSVETLTKQAEELIQFQQHFTALGQFQQLVAAVGQIQQLNTAVGQLQQQVAVIANQPATAGGGDIKQLIDAVSQLQTQVAAFHPLQQLATAIVGPEISYKDITAKVDGEKVNSWYKAIVEIWEGLRDSLSAGSGSLTIGDLWMSHSSSLVTESTGVRVKEGLNLEIRRLRGRGIEQVEWLNKWRKNHPSSNSYSYETVYDLLSHNYPLLDTLYTDLEDLLKLWEKKEETAKRDELKDVKQSVSNFLKDLKEDTDAQLILRTIAGT